jgi:hypothetical protein
MRAANERAMVVDEELAAERDAAACIAYIASLKAKPDAALTAFERIQLVGYYRARNLLRMFKTEREAERAMMDAHGSERTVP